MSDLVEFLRPRLDEDEAKARAADQVDRAESFLEADEATEAFLTNEAGEFDMPRRMLAEVEAKRQILEEHPLMFRDIGWLDEDREEVYDEIEVCARCVPKHSHFTTWADVPTGHCRTVRLLALPYADHPDYRQEWRV